MLTCLVRSSFHPRDPVKGSRASAVARSPCPARPKPDLTGWPRDTLGRRQQPTQIDFFKDEYPRLVPLPNACASGDACGSRRLHHFGGSDSAPAALSGNLGVTPRGASTRTLSFRAARAVPIPLTTRHPCDSCPPVSSEQSLPRGPRPVSHVPVKVTHCSDPDRLPSPGARSSRASYGQARSSPSAVSELAPDHPIPLRLRPRCGPFHDVPSLEELGHLAVVPPSGLGPICSPRCLPRELLGPTSPDDFCSLSRPADASANPDPRRRAAVSVATADRPPSRAPHPAQRGGGRVVDVPRRLSVAAAPDTSVRPSTLRRHPALSRTGSGPRSLSGRPRPRFPHRGANQRWSRRDRVPSLNGPPRRCPVRGFGPGDDALASDRSPSTPLSPPRTPVLTDRTSRSGSVGRGWGVLPITACPTAAPR